MKKLISIILILSTLLSSFIMMVSAEENTVVSDEGRLPFEDVKASHWFADAVEFCYANDVINGMNEYTFGWNGNLTRAQFVTMLAVLERIDTSGYTVNIFDDVKSGHWYYGAVAWAYSEGIIVGMTEGLFMPNSPVTRAQIATIMSNYMKGKYEVEIEYTLLKSFTDEPKPKNWFYESVAYAVSAGLISGIKTEDGLYMKPAGSTTRAQAAVIFESFMEQYYFGSCEHSFTMADCTSSSVCEVCGMSKGLANGHTLVAYDCKTGGVCTTCGADVEPSSRHRFVEATCTTPKTCTICSVKEGKALGHTVRNGFCKRCETENFMTPFDKAAYYMVKKATPAGDGTYSEAARYMYDDGSIEYGIVHYDAHSAKFTLGYTYTWADSGNTMFVEVPIVNGTTVYDCRVEVYNKAGAQLCFSEGSFDPAKVTLDHVSISWKGFSSSGYASWLKELGNYGVIAIADYTDFLLDSIYGGTAADLGFKMINN